MLRLFFMNKPVLVFEVNRTFPTVYNFVCSNYIRESIKNTIHCCDGLIDFGQNCFIHKNKLQKIYTFLSYISLNARFLQFEVRDHRTEN